MKKKIEELGIILLAIAFMLCSLESVVRFYNLSQTLGFAKTFLLSLLPFYAFPTYSVFEPLDFLVKIFLALTPPFIAFHNPLFAPWTLGDWTPVPFCIIGAFLLGVNHKKLFLGRAW
jgi:hypothetical protein